MQDLPPEIILQRQRAILEARKPGKEFDIEATHTGADNSTYLELKMPTRDIRKPYFTHTNIKPKSQPSV
jgi:hypothetical protein